MDAAVVQEKIPQTEVDSFCLPLKPSWQRREEHLIAALNNPWYSLISKLLAQIVEETADFYRQRGFRPALMPITVTSVSSPMGLGSDSLPVQIELFGQKTHLADSLQFQLEFLLRHDHKGLYYVMPSFRGEQADTMHLNQFFHSEAEFSGTLEEVLELAESYVRHLAWAILCGPAARMVKAVAGTLDHLVRLTETDRLPRIRFDDALKLLGTGQSFTQFASDETPIITRHGEQQLLQAYGGAVWLTHMPASIVPFYQAVSSDGTSLTGDLLIGPGEVIGCGERHQSGQQVLASLENHRIDPTDYDWYVKMKTQRPLQTSGFGMGIERFLMWVLNHHDIRDLQIFPRLNGYEVWF